MVLELCWTDTGVVDNWMLHYTQLIATEAPDEHTISVPSLLTGSPRFWGRTITSDWARHESRMTAVEVTPHRMASSPSLTSVCQHADARRILRVFTPHVARCAGKPFQRSTPFPVLRGTCIDLPAGSGRAPLRWGVAQ